MQIHELDANTSPGTGAYLPVDNGTTTRKSTIANIKNAMFPGGAVTDVQVDGSSVVSSGVASISLGDFIVFEEVRDTTSVTVAANSASGMQTYTPTAKSGYTLVGALFSNTGNGSLVPYGNNVTGSNVTWYVRNVSASQITSTARRFVLIWQKN